LILDDIKDSSPLRRGKAATHAISGHAQAINSANFIFVQAVQEARKLSDPGAVDVHLNDLENLYLGQSWDLYWKYNLTCPSVDEYLNMADNKTGGMSRMLLQLMQVESTRIAVFDFDRPTFLPDRFFQVRDDYTNLRPGVYSDQKGFCSGLDEGKFSYPIVHCLEHHPQFKGHIIGILRQRSVMLTSGLQPLSKESKMHIVNYRQAAGTFKACQTHLTEMEAEIEAEIGKLEGVTGEKNPMLHLIVSF
jgi:geranylgeranyl pyrophosphate synthase